MTDIGDNPAPQATVGTPKRRQTTLQPMVITVVSFLLSSLVLAWFARSAASDDRGRGPAIGGNSLWPSDSLEAMSIEPGTGAYGWQRCGTHAGRILASTGAYDPDRDLGFRVDEVNYGRGEALYRWDGELEILYGSSQRWERYPNTIPDETSLGELRTVGGIESWFDFGLFRADPGQGREPSPVVQPVAVPAGSDITIRFEGTRLGWWPHPGNDNADYSARNLLLPIDFIDRELPWRLDVWSGPDGTVERVRIVSEEAEHAVAEVRFVSWSEAVGQNGLTRPDCPAGIAPANGWFDDIDWLTD